MENYGEESLLAGMGAESIKKLLEEIDPDRLSKELKEALKQAQDKRK